MKAGSVALPSIGGATFFGANGSCEPQEQNCRIPIEQRHTAMKKRGKPGCLCKSRAALCEEPNRRYLPMYSAFCGFFGAAFRFETGRRHDGME